MFHKSPKFLFFGFSKIYLRGHIETELELKFCWFIPTNTYKRGDRARLLHKAGHLIHASCGKGRNPTTHAASPGVCPQESVIRARAADQTQVFRYGTREY